MLTTPDLPVVPICRISVALNGTPNQRHISRRPAPLEEGRFAIVTNVGCGMRWTRWHGGRTCLSRTVKSCGPDASTLALNRRKKSADDGDNKARSPGRARRKSLKPFARGKPDLPDRTCGDFARVLFCFAHEAAGAIGIRLSLRPLRANASRLSRSRG